MKKTIENIFNKVSYWQEKRTILGAIDPSLYNNKRAILTMLNISPQLLDISNQAKRDMWNYQIKFHNMGDDILKNTSKEILDDITFAKEAVIKYNRAYLYLSSRLKASREIAYLTAMHENNEIKHNPPILEFMPETHCLDIEIATMATTRNINNIAFAPTLKKNKYFISDLVNLIYEDDIRHSLLRLIDPQLLEDKWFVSKLGCFDGLCEKFRGDVEFVAFSVLNNIKILDKTELFDEKIIRAVFKSSDYKINKAYTLTKLFEYIEHFNTDYVELESKIKDKSLLHRTFWELAQLASSEYSFH